MHRQTSRCSIFCRLTWSCSASTCAARQRSQTIPTNSNIYNLCRTPQHRSYHQGDQDHLMLHQRHCLTPSAHPCRQTASLVGFQSSVFYTGHFLYSAKHNELRLWTPCLTQLGRWIACGACCLSRQELMQKNRGTHSSRPVVETRPAAGATAKGQSQLETHLAAPKKPLTGGMVFSLAMVRRTSSASLTASALSAASCTSSLSLLYLSSKSYTTDHIQSDQLKTGIAEHLLVSCRQDKLLSHLFH